MSPTEGPIAGGTSITVKGTNLGDAEWRIGRLPAAPLSRTNSEVRFQMPAHDSGIALLSARTSTGVAYAEYLYVPPRLDELPAGYITSVAGVGPFVGDGRLATRALVIPVDVTVGPDQSIYIADQEYHRIRRIRPDGVIETIAGTGVHGLDGGGDGGPALDAELRVPLGISLDTAGNLYIVDLSHRLRRVEAITGIITTVAGRPHESGFSGDGGQAANALLNTPVAVVADRDGTIYVQEQGNARIRRIAPDGTISTYAGNGTKGHSGDGGLAINAQIDVGLGDHGGLALDGNGNLYLTEYYHGAIRKIERTTGIITTVARSHDVGGIAVAANGDLYVLSETDAERTSRIIRTDSGGKVLETWGRGNGFTPDGSLAKEASFGYTRGIALDGDGNLLVADAGIQRVRKIDRATGLLTTIAGIGPEILNEDGRAVATALGFDGGDIEALADGTILIGDSSRFRLLERNGTIRTIAQTREIEGVPYPIMGFEPLPDGNVAFTDCRGVRLLTPSGVRPGYIAGHGGAVGYAGDGGPATNAIFSCPNDVVADSRGNLLVADMWNNRVRRIDADTRIITTVAGKGPEGGNDAFGNGSFCGDGGQAVEACLNSPWVLAVDGDNLYIGDSSNNRVRRVDRDRRITTAIAQTGAATLAIDRAGNVYVSSRSNISRFSQRGGRVFLAGAGLPAGFSGDGGPASKAQVDVQTGGWFTGFAIDGEGNFFFRTDDRIRAIRYGAVLAPPGTTIQTTSTGTTIEATVSESDGAPAAGVRVEFDAPSSGASCKLSSTFAITDRDGRAVVTCSPNCAAGTYIVTARPVNSSAAANLTFSNPGRPCGKRRTVRR